ncbi:alanyl-tRNA editing protein [Devosia sp. PTR5]|uniref:Alanine--tRNA ligase n=1 Tax=Devosia oryzisoli TaxID=2774138 RepID=A0A927IRY3_9HYPH|nr:alanyl-tRNA editing protein [Devosia oryzisoli]MBD8064894.1 alanyl-tRNA editing protein [Devosia oryzisoli]
MTEFVFREDAYRREINATITGIADRGAIVLDRTIFYATSGGQPGDTGRLVLPDGTAIAVATAVHPDGDKTQILHVPEEGQPQPKVGDVVTAKIDWHRRHRLMRMHTALHLLSVVFPFPVTGGSIGEDKGRLDFDMPEVPDDLQNLELQLNAMVNGDSPVTSEWISDDEMLANADLIKTMKVKPPMGQGRVRLVRIGEVDLQPCGGTHVARTGEIGPLALGKIEKKGKQNRRVSLLFA